MLTGIILIITTGLLWGVVGLFTSTIATKKLNFPVFAAISCATSAAYFWLFHVKWDLAIPNPVPRLHELVIILAASALLNVIGFLFAQRAMRTGHHAGTWTIAQSALIFPFLSGLIIWKDPPTVIRLTGVAAILFGILSFGLARKIEPQSKDSQDNSIGARGRAQRHLGIDPPANNWFTFALVAFVFLGIHQALNQIPSYWEGWSDTFNLRPAILLTALTICFTTITVAKRQKPKKIEVIFGLSNALISIASNLMLYPGMDILTKHNAGAIVYPLTISVCILFFAAYSILFLKETTTRYHILGLLACLLGALLVAL